MKQEQQGLRIGAAQQSACTEVREALHRRKQIEVEVDAASSASHASHHWTPSSSQQQKKQQIDTQVRFPSAPYQVQSQSMKSQLYSQ